MALSPRHIDALIDILENKLSDMIIWDGEDRKEVVILTGCLKELGAMKDSAGNVVALVGRHRKGDTAA